MGNPSVPFWTPAFNSDDVTVLNKQRVYDGHYQVYRLELQHACFSGDLSPVVVREQLVRHNAASAVLYDPKQDSLILVEQMRVGLIKGGLIKGQSFESYGDSPDSPASDSPWLLEIVAGLIDPGETPEDAIRRESIEETGYEILDLIPILKFYNTPGGFTELTYVYCGIVDSQHPLPHRNLDDDEDLKVHIIKLPEFKDVDLGRWVTSASTVIALQWLIEHSQRIKTKY